MIILIVSLNPLFCEVLTAVLAPKTEAQIVCLPADDFSAYMQSHSPQVIFVDKAMPQECFRNLLDSVLALPRSRLILMQLSKNEITTLDCFQSTLVDSEALAGFIQKAAVVSH